MAVDIPIATHSYISRRGSEKVNNVLLTGAKSGIYEFYRWLVVYNVQIDILLKL